MLIEDGKARAIRPKERDATIKPLHSIDEDLKEKGLSRDEHRRQRERRTTEALPTGTFLWLDELDSAFRRGWELWPHPMIDGEGAEYIAVGREGDREYTRYPMIRHGLEEAVLEGFDPACQTREGRVEPTPAHNADPRPEDRVPACAPDTAGMAAWGNREVKSAVLSFDWKGRARPYYTFAQITCNWCEILDDRGLMREPKTALPVSHPRYPLVAKRARLLREAINSGQLPAIEKRMGPRRADQRIALSGFTIPSARRPCGGTGQVRRGFAKASPDCCGPGRSAPKTTGTATARRAPVMSGRTSKARQFAAVRNRRKTAANPRPPCGGSRPGGKGDNRSTAPEDPEPPHPSSADDMEAIT